ncbi:hypothetical protein L596_018738 [Steinernema carpocapsae]|uniref:Kinesin-like protein n=1 Tax=Steinernema carpocapsae TaxID=34508 RepID=A0A4U5N613_STECR|nr:hypothetical protein L596_018738 [Steinernema carpocapsae]
MSENSSRKRKHASKKKESLEVLCRLTPYSGVDPAVRFYNETTVCTSPPAGLLQRSGSPYPETLYKFGYVFDESESQQDVFERSASDMIEQLVRGKNGLLFTYGVTGSGKTYTMSGNDSGRAYGILPRTMDVLFKSLPCQLDRCVFVPDGKNGFFVRSPSDAEVFRNRSMPIQGMHDVSICGTRKVDGFNEAMVSSVFVSYVEIYNNYCYDLFDEALTDDRTNMSRDLRVNGTSIYVDNLTEVEVASPEEALALYNQAQERRKVADTLLNKTSSRSHSVFNVRVVMAPCRQDAYHPIDDPNQIVVGQLSLVDLAGSERTKRTANCGERLIEAGKINQSLMVLRQCFEKIRERDRTHVKAPIPYRDSKITHLFKNFFDGSGKIRMIICVNPRPTDFEENLNVLNFGELSQEISTTDGPDPVMPKLVDSTNSQFSRRDIMNWRKNFDAAIAQHPQKLNLNRWNPLPQLNWSDPEAIGEDMEEYRKALMTHTAERRIRLDQLVQKRTVFKENFVNVLCQLDLTNNRLKSVVSENEELRSENGRLHKMLNQSQRETAALKLRIARSEAEEEHKFRQDERERKKVAQMEEENRLKNHKIEQMREIFESRTPVSTPRADHLESGTGSVARLRDKFNAPPSHALKSGKPPRMTPRQPRAESASRVQVSQLLIHERESSATKRRRMLLSSSGHPASRIPLPRSKESLKTGRTRKGSEDLDEEPSGGAGFMNAKYHRRSQSAHGRILAHQPNHVIPSGTVMRPKLPKGAKTTTRPEASDLNKSREYILTHQEVDKNGALSTKIVKGDCIPTASGGTAVLFNDVENHSHAMPYRAYD